MKHLITLILAAMCACVQAADYTYTYSTLHESVRYQFDDTVTFTPTVSGTYVVDVVPNTVYGGCSTRYCHSKWSIVTTITSEYVTDGVTAWPLTYGSAAIPMVAGVAYVLHVSGVGTGTGIYANQGAYTVNVVAK